MNAVLELEATITDRGQTTVPSAIRKMLGVRRRGAVVFRGMEDGTVVIAPKAAERTHDDPVLAGFLTLIERDIAARPHALKPLSQELLDRTDALIGGMAVDLDAPLTDD